MFNYPPTPCTLAPAHSRTGVRHSHSSRWSKTAARITWLAMASAVGSSAWAMSTNLQFKAEASLKETFDSNIYLQDTGASPANIAAARAAGLHPSEASRSSWVSSILPKLGLEYKPLSAFTLSATYAPDVSIYHSAGSEDYVAHRGTLGFGGKHKDTLWEFMNAATYIDGSTEGPVYIRPGDVPALGGIPVRDRREAFVFRNNFRVTQNFGDWFVRPMASSYLHDFKTDLRFTPAAARAAYIYENYIDRQEIVGGLDVGYRAFPGTYLVLGYRYGRQDQLDAPIGPGGRIIDSPFDSAYHRVLVGVEGSPVDWLKVNLLIGPDIRQFSDDAKRLFPNFNGGEVLCYMDASISIMPTKSDTITLKGVRYEQPAFSSTSVYEDVRNDITWRHRCTDALTATLGFTLYIGDWQLPANRNDWLYTPNASLSYAFTKKFVGEVAYSYDWVDSQTLAKVEPLTEGREFSRHLATLGLRYTF